MESSDERDRVREALRTLLLAERERGGVRPLAVYRRLLPSFTDIVDGEYGSLVPSSGPGGAPETVRGPVPPLREGEPDAPADAGDPPGGDIGPYRVLREIGRGGMGVVYLAEDTRLPRRVALKVLPFALTLSPALRLRFQREAEVAARLDHPGICTVYEAGESDGTHWIAMRYVEGETLAEAVTAARAGDDRPKGVGTIASRLPGTASTTEEAAPTSASGGRSRSAVMRVVRLLEKAALALHAAHEAGLVHRDIKPANIMATPAGEPVLLDFGVAREMREAAPAITRTGTLVGTPVYMAPEALKGPPGPPDRRLDVYSLGATLYECLTLRLPYEAHTLDALYRRILETEPEDPHRVNPAIPEDLAVVILTALEKDLDRRYQTALDLAEDLRRVREFEPIAARPASPALRLRRWIQRKPAVAAFLLLLLLALAATSMLLVETRDALSREKGTAESLRTEKENLDEALRVVRARVLTAASREALRVDPMLALILARDAVEGVEDPETLGQLHAALAETLERGRVGGHAGPIHFIDWSPDGTLALTASEDGTVRIHGVDGTLRAVLPCGKGRVMMARFSPDGSSVTAACWSGSTLVFDLQGTLTWSFTGHGGPVLGVAWSPDSGRLITTSSDGTARIGTVGEPGSVVLEGHRQFVMRGEFSPDGTRVLTAGADGTARLWSVAGEPRAVLECGGGVVMRALFSPDGGRILTGTSEGAVRLWDGDGNPVATLAGHVEAVADAAFSPRGDLLVTVSHDRTARISGIDGREVVVLRGHDKPIMAVAFSPDGSRIATASWDGSTRLWDLLGRERTVLLGHGVEVEGLAFSPDGRTLLTRPGSQSLETSALLWDLGREAEFILRGSVGWIRGVAFMPDGRGMVVSSSDGTARIREAGGREIVLRGHEGPVRRVVVEDGPERILTASEDGTARLWDFEGRPLAVMKGHGGWVTEAVFEPRGARVLTVSVDGTARLWDSTGREVLQVAANSGPLVIARFSPDGRRFLAASVGHGVGDQGGSVLTWRLDGTDPRTLGPMPANVVSAEFAPDGESLLVAVGRDDPTARLWGPAGQVSASFPHGDDVTSAGFSPDGNRVLTTSLDGTAALWTPEGGRLAVLPDHGCAVLLGAFSPVEGRILTVAVDGSVRLWDRGGRLLLVLRGHSGRPTVAAFSADGRRALTGSTDGTARLWITDPEEIRRVGSARITRTLSPAEETRVAGLLGVGLGGEGNGTAESGGVLRK